MALFERTSRGQSAVELALVAPVLFTLLLMVGDYGRVFFQSITVADAARAGAQYGSQNLTTAVDTTGITNAAANDAGQLSGLSVSSSTFCTCTGSAATVTCGPTACTAPATEKTFVQVNTSATFTTAFNWGITVGGQRMGLPTSTPLSSTSVLEVQQ
ncbi:MAG: TadE/TadG family type IV pilus assembly protein [Candidatus Binataceae bacterium]